MAITTNMAQLPDYAAPYVKDMLAKTAAYTDINENPYEQYTGERTAGFTDLQTKAFTGATNMAPSTYIKDAQGIASLVGTNAPKLGEYDNTVFTSAYKDPVPYAGEGFDNQFQYANTYDPSAYMAGNQFTAPGSYQSGQITSQNFGQPQAEQYMSPYMQSVVEMQQRDAQRQADIAGTQRNAQAVGAGAFGGSRQAIMDAEAARNLALQKGDIQAQGLQNAFQQAQAQFNADQGRGLTAQQASEQSRQFGAGQGLQSALGAAQYGQAAQAQNQQAQQYAANLGLQGALGAAQYGTAAEQANMQNRQFGANLAMQNALNAANYGLQAQQLSEQSKQYGAGLGLQGQSIALQAANTLGNLGTQEFNQNKDISGLQYLYGTAQQQNQQAINNVDYQNYLAAQTYPQQMLQFQSNMLNGLPMNSATQNTPDPSLLSQGIGLIGAIGSFFAEGGSVGEQDDGDPGIMALMASKYA